MVIILYHISDFTSIRGRFLDLKTYIKHYIAYTVIIYNIIQYIEYNIQ